jgi:LysM repeat protein
MGQREFLKDTWRIAISVPVMAFLVTGCMTHKPTAPPPTGNGVYGSGTTAKVDAIIRNAKQEVASLRADLGAARIAATKKDVEAEELRRDLTQYRQRLSELQLTKEQQQYTGEKQHQELTAIKTEQERLLREKQDLQRELAELPKLREALAASRASEGQVQAKVKELETALAALAEQLTKTREPRSNEPASDDQSTELPPSNGTSSLPGETSLFIASTTDGVHKDGAVFMTTLPSLEPEWISVTVKPGDTLWDLARAHGVSIERLKTVNKLSSDVIRPGRTLLVPSKP